MPRRPTAGSRPFYSLWHYLGAASAPCRTSAGAETWRRVAHAALAAACGVHEPQPHCKPLMTANRSQERGPPPGCPLRPRQLEPPPPAAASKLAVAAGSVRAGRAHCHPCAVVCRPNSSCGREVCQSQVIAGHSMSGSRKRGVVRVGPTRDWLTHSPNLQAPSELRKCSRRRKPDRCKQIPQVLPAAHHTHASHPLIPASFRLHSPHFPRFVRRSPAFPVPQTSLPWESLGAWATYYGCETVTPGCTSQEREGHAERVSGGETTGARAGASPKPAPSALPGLPSASATCMAHKIGAGGCGSAAGAAGRGLV